MGPTVSLRTTFKKSQVIAPIYTGGPIAVTSDGARLVSCADEVLLTNVADGRKICSFSLDSSDPSSVAVSSSSKYLAIFTSSFALSIYLLPTDSDGDGAESTVRPHRTVARAHDAPVHVAKIDDSSSFLASGAADGVVKVWDLARGYTTHVFKNHGGVISALHFHRRFTGEDSELHLITAAADTRVLIYNLSAGSSREAGARPMAILEGHSSVPRGIAVSRDSKQLFTGGRDAVVIVWDYEYWTSNQKHKSKATIPHPRIISAYERVEALGILKSNDPLVATRFYTGGDSGTIRIWDADRGSVMKTYGQVELSAEGAAKETQREILDVLEAPKSQSLISVHADQNIFFYSMEAKDPDRQIVGYNDEIIDCTVLSSGGAEDSHLALATNSSLIRLYSLDRLDAKLLAGHHDIVLCLNTAHGRRIFGSGSKDNTAIIWRKFDNDSQWVAAGTCQGHTESVGSIAFPGKSADPTAIPYVFTGSQDRTIKMWDLSPLNQAATTLPVPLRALHTLRAHDKDINALDVSPDNSFLASGSQDKTAKIFKITHSRMAGGYTGNFVVLGVCTGHKRGVWDVKFGSSSRTLASASGDRTVKLWDMESFACIGSFEGHTNAVLRVKFINQDSQIVTSGSDGLVKLWETATEQCVGTLDNHENKVWALAIGSDESKIYSGAADSLVTVWEDCTEQEITGRNRAKAEAVLKEQSLSNYLLANDYSNAVVMALSLGQPGRLYNIFKSAIGTDSAAEGTVTGNAAIDGVIKSLSETDSLALLHHVQNWNASARSSQIAQVILNAILRLKPYEIFAKLDGSNLLVGDSKCSSISDILDHLIPYTERHLSRLDRLSQESYVLDMIIGEMDEALISAEDTGMKTPPMGW